MLRLKAGLTGLALVFLVTLVGSLAYSPAPSPTGPSEPLSQLGVAPSPAPSRPKAPVAEPESPIADREPPLPRGGNQVSI